MTPAITFLRKNNITFQLHQYQHDNADTNFGAEAARKLKVNAERIYKTLILQYENNPHHCLVAVIPVTKKLDLKKFAAAFNVKKVMLADPVLVEKQPVMSSAELAH